MQSDLESTVRSICLLIFICFSIGATTYSCTQPKTIDQEAQAIRVIETQKMQACVRAGGAWMPVRDAHYGPQRSASDYYTTSMSCVTDKTLPLATKMNTGA